VVRGEVSSWAMFAALLALSLGLSAGETDLASRAKDRFDRATKLFTEKRYKEAVLMFQEAYAAAAHTVILYDIGKCHERLGDPAMALRSFREYRRLEPSSASDVSVRDDIANAERLLAELGVQQLAVQINPSTARVTVDGSPLGPSPAYVELKPGEHTIIASADGYEPLRNLSTSLRIR
jgi:hypothetical protein